MFEVNLNATDGFLLVNNHIQYKFSKAIVSGQFYNNDLLISKADFFKNSKLEYTFHNVRISKNALNIEKVEHISHNKVQYIISNTTINDMIVTKSTLKIKNNADVSNYIKSKFDIDLIGNTDLNLSLTGNLEKFNFNFQRCKKYLSNICINILLLLYFKIEKNDKERTLQVTTHLGGIFFF